MNLYWVTTPCQYENWFTVAKSKKEAEIFHENAEGFGSEYATAKLICYIPKELVEKYKIKEPVWPPHELITDLEGKIITTDNPRKVNFNGVIYKEGTCTENLFFDVFGEKSGVYIIKIQNANKYKIGFTKNLKRRIKQFSTGNPENIKIVYFIATKEYEKLEIKLHKAFEKYRISGEWFEFDEANLTELDNKLVLIINESLDNFEFYNLKLVSIIAGVY